MLRKTVTKVLSSSLILSLAAAMAVPMPFSRAAGSVTEEVAVPVGYKDDFFEAVNADAFASHEIAPTDSSWSWFKELSNIQDTQREEIFKEINKTDTWPHGTSEQKMHDLYALYSDVDSRRADGLGEFQPYLDEILASSDLTELVTAMMKLEIDTGFASILPVVYVTTDDMDSTRYIVGVDAGDSLLGKEYYETPGYEPYIELYDEYLTAELMLNGFSESDTLRMVQNSEKVAKKIAAAQLAREEWYDMELTYNIYTMDDLKELFSNIDMKAYCDAQSLGDQPQYLVPQEEACKVCNSLLTENNLQMLKDYAVTVLINDLAGYTTPEAYDLSVEYSNRMNGISERKSNEYYWMSTVANAMEWDYGKLYAEKYCSPEAKKEVESIISQVRQEYEQIIAGQEWMSEDTKKMATAKLDSLIINVAYPDDWDYYLSLSPEVIPASEGGSLTKWVISASRESNAYDLSLLGTTVDKTKWISTPQTVNAFYSPSHNSITILAGIMQPPMYDPDASFEANLGGIGMIIAHEISHAFDSNGSEYDAAGNYNPWWTATESDQYDDMCDAIVDYYDQYYDAEAGANVDGSLTLTENIADLGAMYCVSQICGDEPAKLREMYTAYAYMWATKRTREYAQYLIVADTHSPSFVRVNAVLSSMDKFYIAYDIKEGDGMYVAPQKRVGIWR